MKIKSFTSLALPLVLSAQALATPAKSDLEISAGIGELDIKSSESVFREDKTSKLSRLDFNAKAKVFTFGIKSDVSKRVTLSGNFYTTFSDDNNGHMEDRDWLDPDDSDKLTDLSIHEKTKLRNAYQVDLSATYWLYQRNSLQLGLMGGYQHDHSDWDSYGGSYWYDQGAEQFTQPDSLKVINYKQDFHSMYLGLDGVYTFNKSSFGIKAKYAPLIYAIGNDYHISRDVHFTDESAKGQMMSIGATYNYAATKNLNLYASYAYTYYKEATANATIYDERTGETFKTYGENSLGSKSSLISAGIKYTF